MATPKRSTPNGPAVAFYKRLKALGYTFCRPCFAYMPEIHQHVESMALDRHASRYVLVGDYGHVRAIDTTVEEVAA